MKGRNRNGDGDARLIDTADLAAYLSLGKTSAVVYARSIGAERRFGKRLLFDKVVIDRALNKTEAGAQL